MVFLLKLGVDYQSIQTMAEGEVAALVAAFNAIADPAKQPGKTRTHKVKR